MNTVSALSSAAEILNNLLLHDAPATTWVGYLRGGVAQLLSELNLIKHILISDEDARKYISREVKQQLTHLSHDIEDAVDSYTQPAADSKGLFNYYIFKMSLLKQVHIVKRKIDELKHQIIGVRDILSIIEPQENRKRAPAIVGIEKDAERLRSFLLGKERKLSVICICGESGKGKTTLAKQLYNDPLVVNHFDIRAWVLLDYGDYFDYNFESRSRDTLKSILFSLGSFGMSKDEIAGMDMAELMEELHKVQKRRRYVVVLDELYFLESWDALRAAFRDDNQGSRIVITTGRVQLIEYTNSSTALFTGLHGMDWEIFRCRSGLRHHNPGKQVNPEMEKVGRQIVINCKGLPFLVTHVAGLLRGKNLIEWKNMLRILMQGNQNIDHLHAGECVLASTYKKLPFHLKPFFLYLGLFPQNEVISVEKLYLLWMAEGLISRRALNIKTGIEVVEDYLSKLVDANMVFVVSASTRFKSWLLHNAVREFCIWKGKKEEFLEAVDFGDGDKISCLSSRLAIYLNKFEDTNDVILNISEAKRIRSIIFFDRDESLPKSTWPRELSDLEKFQGTRVLGFDGVDFRVKNLPRGIHKLIYLRHLSFQGCYLEEFPSSFSAFPFLETLDLRVLCMMTITNVLWKISSLRHLYFPPAFRGHTEDVFKLDTLQKLEVLENFDVGLCNTDDIVQLENLQILTAVVNGNTMDLNKFISYVNENRFLRHQSLVVKLFDCYSKERLSTVAALLKCNYLHGLEIEGLLDMTIFDQGIGSNFTSMVFNGSEFSEDPMPILGKLPKLRSLVLCNDALVGKKMVCSESDFPQLTSLTLASLQFLEKWEVEGAMPNLTVITIEQCNKLEVPPCGLFKIQALPKFMIESMPKEFQDQVNKMIQEWRSYDSRTL